MEISVFIPSPQLNLNIKPQETGKVQPAQAFFNRYFNSIFNYVSTAIHYLLQLKARSCILLKLDLHDLNLFSLLKGCYPNSLPVWASQLLFLLQQAASKCTWGSTVVLHKNVALTIPEQATHRSSSILLQKSDNTNSKG